MTGNDETSKDEAGRRAREEAEWKSIVDNYGDQPEASAPDPEPPAPADDRWPSLRSGALHEEPAELAPLSWEVAPEDDRYVPPPAPPIPRPHGLRLVAWLGLFGVPTVVLVAIVLKISLPPPLGFLALLWFVGGFGYLVATMNGPKDPDGGWDDGAVV